MPPSIQDILRQAQAEPLHREFTLDRQHIDEENRTIALSFSSETVVKRSFGGELLDHGPDSVDLSRLERSAPLLLNHDPEKQIGVVESARIDQGDKMGRAVVRFSRSALGEEIFQDVKDGIRPNVSVGYRIDKLILDEASESEGETYRATRWTPHEITLASIPADFAVGVGRSQTPGSKTTTLSKPDSQTQPIPNMPDNSVTPPAPAATPAVTNPEPNTRSLGSGDGVEITLDAGRVRAQEQQRIHDITQLSARHGITDDKAQEFIRGNRSVNDFNAFILEDLAARHQPTPPGTSPMNIGMSAREIDEWSVVNAVRGIVSGNFDGIEAEASRAVAQKVGQQPAGFFIPNDVAEARRDLSAGSASAGGYLVGGDVAHGSMIDLLRNRMKVKELGAIMLTGLTHDVPIPTIETAATAEAAAENAQLTGSNPTFGQKTLTPHRVGAKVPISKQLILQSGANVEGLVRNDITKIIALECDRQCLHGDGAAGEITGIANTTGVGAVTFGATATWAKAVEFETDVAAANADIGSMAYLTDAAVRGAWKTIKKDSGSGIFIWEGDTVNGYAANVSQQVSGSVVMFGVWSELVIGEFGSLDITVDNITLADKNQIQLIANYHMDMVTRHPAAFSVSADSGNQ